MKHYFRPKAIFSGFFLFLFFATADHLIAQPQLAWAQQIGGEVNIVSTEVDQQGNIYCSGEFFDVTDFDSSPLGSFIMDSENGRGFVLKLTPSGGFLWAVQFQVQHAPRVKLDTYGNLYVSGNTHETKPIDLDPGPGEVIHENNKPQFADVFIVKLDENGNYIWGHAMGSEYLDNFSDVAVDPVDNGVYMWGSFYGSGDFDPGPGEYILDADTTGFSKDFILKMDADGQFSWAYAYDTNIYVRGIHTNSNAGVFVVGGFFNTADFDPGIETHELSTESGCGFVLNLNSNGTFQSVQKVAYTVSTPAASSVLAITFDSSDNMYLAGSYEGKLDFDPGPGVHVLPIVHGDKHFFILKLSPSNEFLWANGYFESILAYGFSNMYLATDQQGNLFMTGAIDGPLDFDAGPGQADFTANGEQDAFVLKLLPDGQFDWVLKIGGAYFDSGIEVNFDNNNQQILSGTFGGTVDLDPGTGVLYFNAAGNFSVSGFLVKFSGVTGIPQLESLEQLPISPNPATDWIKTPAGIEAETYTIYNQQGVQLAKGRITDKNEAINISGLPPGSYIVSFNGKGMSRIGKFLKLQNN